MKTISVKQAARLAHVTPEAIRKRVKRGVLPDRRHPGARKIILFESDLVLSEVKLYRRQAA